jgi:hypothetical protein
LGNGERGCGNRLHLVAAVAPRLERRADTESPLPFLAPLPVVRGLFNSNQALIVHRPIGLQAGVVPAWAPEQRCLKATLIKWRDPHRVQTLRHACCVAKRRLVALASRAVRVVDRLNATALGESRGSAT